MSPQTNPADIDHDRQSFRYYRNAVERHWDPHEIDIEADKENIQELNDDGFEAIRRGLALFGAGEEAVTEDLAPLSVVLESIEDQMFVTTQIYEEAKHADFFDRYWENVINPEEERRGQELTSPRDDEWFPPAYVELFDRNEEAMHRLLTDDSPENRAIAISHYHLTVEGIIGQVGYYGFQNNFGGQYEELPELPGLVEGFSNIRSDEGRHVGFGMWQLKKMVADGEVDFEVVEETVNELFPIVQEIVTADPDEQAMDEDVGMPNEELVDYAVRKHSDRMNQISDSSLDMPDVDELVSIES